MAAGDDLHVRAGRNRGDRWRGRARAGAAAAAGAKIVFADNLYMYGPVQGPLTEDLPHRASGPKGTLRAELAEALLDAPHTLHYLDDMAAGLVLLGERAEADGQVWHLPAAEPLQGRQRAFGPGRVTPHREAIARTVERFKVRGLGPRP